MKKLVRKSMFVLSFLGLFTFAAPKQAKADVPSEYPCTKKICCPDGHCEYCFCDSEETYREAIVVICSAHSGVVD